MPMIRACLAFGAGCSGARYRGLFEAIGQPCSRGHDTLEVVGESHYQDALWEIVGGFRRDPVRHPIEAVLAPEPANPHDPNAVGVVIEGLLTGYLSREDAVAYLPGLLRLMQSCPTGRVALEGHIVGGGPRPDGIGFLGVFLDHDPTDFGLSPHVAFEGTLRTGLSQAIATDLEDDSYDLVWLATLPADDAAASKQLRALLRFEQDPIDRHYMLCELARRLYRRRNEDSALNEFDAVCRQHHEEMQIIRPALLDKFDAVPVIDLYRQAAIRWQKAKQWDQAREWAQRGVSIYGDAGARPEVVEDLRKRVAYATAKLQIENQPKQPRRTSLRQGPAGGLPAVETLTCENCGQTFERERTRGRKPRACPTCRGIPTA